MNASPSLIRQLIERARLTPQEHAAILASLEGEQPDAAAYARALRKLQRVSHSRCRPRQQAVKGEVAA
jgi:hypothetical protein